MAVFLSPYAVFSIDEEAREYMTRKEVLEYKEVIKNTALDTTPERCSTVYYAVAHGANPGIREPGSTLLHLQFVHAIAYVVQWKNGSVRRDS